MSEKLPIDRPWAPALNWDTAAGRALSTLLAGLQAAGGEWLVNIFGSAPLQMAYSQEFLSNDIETSVSWHREPDYERIITEHHLGRGQAEIYIQSCKEAAFRTSPKWKDRAFRDVRGGVTLRFAHPMDILIGKLNRLEEKDLKAFYLVQSETAEPTEQTLLRELREAPDLFSHAYMAPHGAASYAGNVSRFWKIFFERDIDVEREILIPANEFLQRDYDMGESHKANLRSISRRAPASVVSPPAGLPKNPA
jgi:hypothetical protein